MRALGRDDGITQHGAQKGKGNAQVHQCCTPRSHNRLKHTGHRGVGKLCQLSTRHNTHGKDGYQQVDSQDADERRDGGTADVLAEARTARDDHCALDAQEDPNAHANHADNLIEQRGAVGLAPEVVHEDGRVEVQREDDGHDGHEQGDYLRNGGKDVDARRFLHAAAHQEPAYPHDDGGAHHRGDVIALAEHREEERQAGKQQGGVGDVCHERADPVAVGGKEAHVLAEPGTCIAVDAAHQLGFIAGKGEEAHHEAEHAQTGNHPADKHTAGVGAGCSHIAGHGEHATADDRSDNRRHKMREGQSVYVIYLGHSALALRHKNQLSNNVGLAFRIKRPAPTQGKPRHNLIRVLHFRKIARIN